MAPGWQQVATQAVSRDRTSLADRNSAERQDLTRSGQGGPKDPLKNDAGDNRVGQPNQLWDRRQTTTQFKAIVSKLRTGPSIHPTRPSSSPMQTRQPQTTATSQSSDNPANRNKMRSKRSYHLIPVMVINTLI